MNRLKEDFKEFVEIYTVLAQEAQEAYITYLEAVASMDAKQKAEMQRLCDRLDRLQSEDDRVSFMKRAHEYATRIADGEAAKDLWAEWCKEREKEEREGIDALNEVIEGAVNRVMNRPIDS
ncbi:MAG: hypothetical protein IJ625_02395 [Acidaminococcaceae bacterium]|nr:hypothetical protein [Acidaminococcaceae bacterium]MBR1511491.1 hypothetical protein [Acidaminococcaceae bacterium]